MPRVSKTNLTPRLRRGLRRISRSVLPPGVDFVYAPEYSVDLTEFPADSLRGERILAYLLGAGIVRRWNVHRPRPASLKDLRRVHHDDYLESLTDLEALTPILGFEVPDEFHARALEVQRYATGGTLMAARHALTSGRIQVNLGGGYHHARAGRGAGFCIFNDVAVAVAELREQEFEGPVLVVDLDLHDGDGTRSLFADDPSVFTLSIHNRSWDLEPARASLALELGSGVGDDEYLRCVRRHLPSVVEEVQPELVIYLAGTDPAFDDRIGDWEITPAGMLERDRWVVTLLREHNPRLPIVVLLAGGYGHRAWRYSARFLSWLVTDRTELEPPSTGEMTLARYRKLTREFTVRELTGEKDEDLWTLTEEDVYGGLGVGARETRLLGFYSHHGIELVLERTGVMDQLRQVGFAHPTLDLDLDSPGGHTVRLFSDRDRAELLMEMRLLRDRRSLKGLELLKLEWLLLQNPRAEFPPGARPMPGQKHPGLGMLHDVMALLVLLCERLKLAGILFVPSHFHLAVTGLKYLRFLRPEDEVWFHAVRKALEHLPLVEASQAVSDGHLIDGRTGEAVDWRPMLMVVPLADSLQELLDREDHALKAASAAEGSSFELID